MKTLGQLGANSYYIHTVFEKPTLKKLGKTNYFHGWLFGGGLASTNIGLLLFASADLSSEDGSLQAWHGIWEHWQPRVLTLRFGFFVVLVLLSRRGLLKRIQVVGWLGLSTFVCLGSLSSFVLLVFFWTRVCLGLVEAPFGYYLLFFQGSWANPSQRSFPDFWCTPQAPHTYFGWKESKSP